MPSALFKFPLLLLLWRWAVIFSLVAFKIFFFAFHSAAITLMHQDTDFFYLSYLGLTKWEITVPLESVDCSSSFHRIISNSLFEHSLCCIFSLFPQRCIIKHTVDCLSLHFCLYSTDHFLLQRAGLKILLIFPLFINSWFNLYRVCYQQLSKLLASIMKQYSHRDSIMECFQTHIPFHSSCVQPSLDLSFTL